MFLSEAQQQVLYYCYRHKYVSISSLHLLFPRGTSREQVRRQLTKMVHAEILKRFKIFKGRTIVDMLYTVNALGLAMLNETVQVSKVDYEYVELKQSYQHRSVLADIDIRLRATSGIEWYSENESVHRYGEGYNEIIRPDGAISMTDATGNVSTMFIEYEHTSRPKELSKKIKNYDNYLLYDSYINHPYIKMGGTVSLWIIVDTDLRQTNCLSILEQMDAQHFNIEILTINAFKKRVIRG